MKSDPQGGWRAQQRRVLFSRGRTHIPMRWFSVLLKRRSSLYLARFWCSEAFWQPLIGKPCLGVSEPSLVSLMSAYHADCAQSWHKGTFATNCCKPGHSVRTVLAWRTMNDFFLQLPGTHHQRPSRSTLKFSSILLKRSENRREEARFLGRSSSEWTACNSHVAGDGTRVGAAAEAQWWRLAPAEGHGARSVGALLDQWLVELAARTWVNLGPAVLAIVLQARHVGAEEGRKFAAATRPLTLVAHLVVEHVRLHLHLQNTNSTM